MTLQNVLCWSKTMLLNLFLLILTVHKCKSTVISENRICTSFPNSHFYLNTGNVAIISHGGETESPDSANNASVLAPDRCFIKIITCASCHLSVSVDYLDIAPCTENNTFKCDHLIIREPEYENSITEFYTSLYNYSKVYESQTRMLFIEYFSSSFGSNFSFTLTALDNVYKVKGHSMSYRWNYTSIIESPHFPFPYPSDYSSKYLLENLDKRGFIQIIFSDFTLSSYSFIEIFDSNGTKVEFYNGNSFRPPVITSSGPNLTLNFKANDESPNIGFRATIYFISFYGKHILAPPITDCGGFVEDFGGSITMTNMPSTDYQQAYDCVWILRPRLSNHETHLSVKVVEFESLDSGSTLKIHEGLTSQSYLLETVTSNRNKNGPAHSLEYVVHLSTGFYIRLHGYFNNESKIAIVYSSFRFASCIPVKDFQCNNGRCIRPLLHCDGYNHCGDGSDEMSCNTKLALLTATKTDGNFTIIILHPRRWKKGKGRYMKPPSRIITSPVGTLSPEEANWWRTLTPNSFYPKQDNSSGAGTNTLILITSLAGLGMFILTTALILVKLHKQKRDDSLNREVLSTISADIDSSSSSLRSNFGTPAEPPVYDPPPSYEDVVKFYFPPPPTYNTAITRAQSGATHIQINNHRTFQSGVENAAFIPDTHNAASTANPRRCIAPLLTVILPASRLLGLNRGQENSSNVASSEAVRGRRNPVEKQESSQKVEAKTSISRCDNINLLVVGDDDDDTEQPLPSYESACSQARRLREETQSCSCIGACACSIETNTSNSNETLLSPSNFVASNINGNLNNSASTCNVENSIRISSNIEERV